MACIREVNGSIHMYGQTLGEIIITQDTTQENT